MTKSAATFSPALGDVRASIHTRPRIRIRGAACSRSLTCLTTHSTFNYVVLGVDTSVSCVFNWFAFLLPLDSTCRLGCREDTARHGVRRQCENHSLAIFFSFIKPRVSFSYHFVSYDQAQSSFFSSLCFVCYKIRSFPCSNGVSYSHRGVGCGPSSAGCRW